MKPEEVFIVFFAGGRFIFPPAHFFGGKQASLSPFCVFPFSLFRDLLSQLPFIFRHLLLFVSSFRDFLFRATIFFNYKFWISYFCLVLLVLFALPLLVAPLLLVLS